MNNYDAYDTESAWLSVGYMVQKVAFPRRCTAAVGWNRLAFVSQLKKKKWWNSKKQLSARSSPAKRLVNSCVCSVGRGFQAADSPVCYMLICRKNLKSLGGSSSILLGCPVHVSVQADAQRPLVPEYGGFLSSSSTSPHYFISSHQPSRTCNHAPPPPTCKQELELLLLLWSHLCPPTPTPDLQRLSRVWEQRKPQLLAREMPGRCLEEKTLQEVCFFLSLYSCGSLFLEMPGFQTHALANNADSLNTAQCLRQDMNLYRTWYPFGSTIYQLCDPGYLNLSHLKFAS